MKQGRLTQILFRIWVVLASLWYAVGLPVWLIDYVSGDAAALADFVAFIATPMVIFLAGGFFLTLIGSMLADFLRKADEQETA